MVLLFKYIVRVVPLLIIPLTLFSQPVPTRTWNSAQIQAGINRLNVLGTVLYVAAHPDDENTRMISWLALDRGYETAYMSLTRGDGGQNLIGTELGVELGLIRTQELLAARALDGGKQFFSSAYDFGFSKNPEETFSIWDKEKVLSELVWVIRYLQPDVIVTRFTPEPSPTHGHHTASAQLAVEAFSAAADPNRFPEQLKEVPTWQTKRIFWNTSWWFFGTKDFDKTGFTKAETGSYLPFWGQSVGEIAAESRSRHSSQGFGTARQRGNEPEYLKLLAGEEAPNDLMENINTSWSRLPGSGNVQKAVQKVQNEFSSFSLHKSVTGLLALRAELKKLPYSVYRDRKIKETEFLITQCAGFFAEALLPSATVIQGDSLRMKMEFVQRSPLSVKLQKLYIGSFTENVDITLHNNEPYTLNRTPILVNGIHVSHPYWIEKDKSKGMFNAGDPKNAVQPYNSPPISVYADVSFNGAEPFRIEIPLVYKYTTPDKGELFKYPEIVPELSINPVSKATIMKSGERKTVLFRVISHSAAKKTAVVSFRAEGNVNTSISSINVEIEGVGSEKIVSVDVFGGSGKILPAVEWNGNYSDYSFFRISYPHIPNLPIQAKATHEVVELDLKTSPLRIGYLDGAGDEIPSVLKELGYTVEFIRDHEIVAKELLNRFDVIVAGIRAYNTREILVTKNNELLEYVKLGGRYVVQYNTTASQLTDKIGPYPLKITRNRITVEEAPLTLLNPTHKLFNIPNKITGVDFDGWVQERGLYFVEDTESAYVKLLSGNDPNEPENQGILLYTDYGKGQFIYTGISFFRQLPAANPGAIRLFVNILGER